MAQPQSTTLPAGGTSAGTESQGDVVLSVPADRTGDSTALAVVPPAASALAAPPAQRIASPQEAVASGGASGNAAPRQNAPFGNAEEEIARIMAMLAEGGTSVYLQQGGGSYQICGGAVDFYEVLKINQDRKNLKKHYKLLSKLLDPKQCQHPDAGKAHAVVAAAYQTLSSRIFRKFYNLLVGYGDCCCMGRIADCLPSMEGMPTWLIVLGAIVLAPLILILCLACMVMCVVCMVLSFVWNIITCPLRLVCPGQFQAQAPTPGFNDDWPHRQTFSPPNMYSY